MPSGKYISLLLRILFAFMLILNYLVFTFILWFPYSLKHHWGFIILLIFNLLFIMASWTTLTASYSDPGQVPVYWGFYIGDPDTKRNRYCLMCNVFKPIRCHHCSMCNRCVLNMDHHCPWINNCIGFYNRKFFIQMVFYINCTLVFILCCNGKWCYDSVMSIINNRTNFNMEFMYSCGLILLYLLDCVMEVILGQFFVYHIKLIRDNKTTIETLNHKGTEFDYVSTFSRGLWENVIQVMGTHKVLWFLPLKDYMGKPKGNGIDWVGVVEEMQSQGNDTRAQNNNNNSHGTDGDGTQGQLQQQQQQQQRQQQQQQQQETQQRQQQQQQQQETQQRQQQQQQQQETQQRQQQQQQQQETQQRQQQQEQQRQHQQEQQRQHQHQGSLPSLQQQLRPNDIEMNNEEGDRKTGNDVSANNISNISGLPLRGHGHPGTSSMGSMYEGR